MVLMMHADFTFVKKTQVHNSFHEKFATNQCSPSGWPPDQTEQEKDDQKANGQSGRAPEMPCGDEEKK